MDAVFKVRNPLAYRLPVLDDSIRRQRTIREAEMIHLAKRLDVPVPYLYDVDVPGATLVLEYIRGRRLKDSLPPDDGDGAIPVFEDFGKGVAKLHAGGMVHGDLTTANAVIREGRVVFMDFGLAFRTIRLEDRAVDLRLIKETLSGAHPGIYRAALEGLFRGYSEVSGAAVLRDVQRQLRSIERRGRYARVT